MGVQIVAGHKSFPVNSEIKGSSAENRPFQKTFERYSYDIHALVDIKQPGNMFNVEKSYQQYSRTAARINYGQLVFFHNQQHNQARGGYAGDSRAALGKKHAGNAEGHGCGIKHAVFFIVYGHKRRYSRYQY